MKNKFMFFVFCALALVSVVFLSGCGQKGTSVPVVNENTIQTEMPAENSVVDCKGDQNCLHTNFLVCQPLEFKMPFIQDAEYAITVIGAENGICHYRMSVTGQPINDCLVPMKLITEDRFGHFFGAEKVPGKERIAAEQQSIDNDYCQQE